MHVPELVTTPLPRGRLRPCRAFHGDAPVTGLEDHAADAPGQDDLRQLFRSEREKQTLRTDLQSHGAFFGLLRAGLLVKCLIAKKEMPMIPRKIPFLTVLTVFVQNDECFSKKRSEKVKFF